MELKNKNIYDVSNYELHYDYGSFYNQFKELIEIPDYNSLNINSENSDNITTSLIQYCFSFSVKIVLLFLTIE